MSKVLAIVFHPATQIVIVAMLGIVIRQFVKYKNLYNEIVDIGQSYNAVINSKSNGGKTITTQEWAMLGKEVAEALQAAGALVKAKNK